MSGKGSRLTKQRLDTIDLRLFEPLASAFWAKSSHESPGTDYDSYLQKNIFTPLGMIRAAPAGESGEAAGAGHYATNRGLGGVPVRAVDFRGAEIIVDGCVQIESAAFEQLHDCHCRDGLGDRGKRERRSSRGAQASFAVGPAEAPFVDNLAVPAESDRKSGHVRMSGDLIIKIAKSGFSGRLLAARI